jgi:MFS family permease
MSGKIDTEIRGGLGDRMENDNGDVRRLGGRLGVSMSAEHWVSGDISVSEFRGRTGLVAGSFFGMFICMPAILIYSLGPMMLALHGAFGWSRSEISFSYTVSNVALLLGSAFAGHVADRYGARLVGSVALGAFALVLLAIPFFVHDLLSFYIAYFLASLAGVGATSVVLLRPLLQHFDKRRGIAVGVAMSGAGLAAFVLPQFTVSCLSIGGWRMVYWGLGALVLIGLVPTVIMLRSPTTDRTPCKQTEERGALHGLSFREALPTRQFWILSVICLCAGAATTGLVIHLVPLLKELSGSLARAAALASALGLASAVGRFAAGFTLDWWRSPLVGFVLFGAAALGVAVLRVFGIEFGIVAMALCGLVAGAEADFIAYLCSRYFGARSLGSIYGWTYGLVSLGAAIGPLSVGLMRDRFGNYNLALDIVLGAFVFMALLTTGLGAFRYAPHDGT